MYYFQNNILTQLYFRISCDISKEEFTEKYLNKREPVVLEGCQDDWPARDWTFDNILDRFPGEVLWETRFKNASIIEEMVQVRAKKDIFPLLEDPKMALKIFTLLPVEYHMKKLKGELSEAEMNLDPSSEFHKVPKRK